jgi:hypothetical protein
MTLVQAIHDRLSDERGIALPVVMGVLGVMLLLGGVAVQDSGRANDSANEDRRSAMALQAADAGVEAAVYRLNTLDATNQPAAGQRCVIPNASGELVRTGYQTVSDQQWCPQVQETLPDGTSFAYRVSPQIDLPADASGVVRVTRNVISVGVSGGVQRRVIANLSAVSGAPLFGEYSVISLQALTIPNSVFIGRSRSPWPGQAGGGARSNGNITLDNSGTICGSATPGPGRQIFIRNAGRVCTGGATAPATTPAVLSPINANVAAINDNARICASTNGQVTQTADPCTTGGNSNSIKWTPAQRRLDINNNATVTLGGSVYSFCYLRVDNSAKLIIAPKDPGSSVRIYIDSPQNCANNPNPKGIFELVNNSSITNQNGASALQFYVSGNESNPASSVINLNNSTSSELPMVIYAPFSVVSIRNNVTIRGAVAAWSVQLDNSATILYDQSASTLQTSNGVFPLLRKQQYRECTPAGATAANLAAGC